ncbi:hypothetical protein NYO91_13635 [Arhodomonas aquaeolei]|uniref:hypothetical protein n=1 Tax=Arhodomonas aquaeolei TaxID=2369 RepID=UPI002169D361|nr:hypothetical protein [Arhodomonas aquaeolei]MCS4505123.1 hypothetical protein [Arhodomonas aquaeolei]
MSSDTVGRTADLEPLEQYLLRAFRSAACALQYEPDALARAVDAELGNAPAPADGDIMRRHFRALMATIARYGRRTIRFHATPCPCLGADEAAFLRLHGRMSSGSEANAIAHHLVEAEAVPTLLQHASVIALYCAQARPERGRTTAKHRCRSRRQRPRTAAGERLH